jgi:hypothetical protein
MTAAIGLLQLGLLSFILFALAGALACQLIARHVLPRFERLAPAVRVRALAAFASAPLLLALACTGACFAPWLFSGVFPGLDHCLHHGGHPHLCFEHLPDSSGQPLGWSLVAAASIYLGVQLVSIGKELLRARRLLGTLRASARADSRHSTLHVDQGVPFCFAVGLLRPEVVVSYGLMQHLPGPELAAVVAHEIAHARRRDALLLMLARCASFFHLPDTRRRVMEELELSCEMACDREAANAVGDPLLVASAIVTTKRLLQGTAAPAGVGIANFGGRAVEARVRALLDEPRTGRLVPGAFVILGALSLLAVACADPLHHATETLLSVFTH